MKKTKKEPRKRVSSNFSVGAAAPTEWEKFQTVSPIYSTRARVSSAQSTKSEQLLKEIRRKTKRVFLPNRRLSLSWRGYAEKPLYARKDRKISPFHESRC